MKVSLHLSCSRANGRRKDPGADSGEYGKSKRTEKMARRKVKNGNENPLGKCFTRPVPNGRSRGQQTLESFRLFLHAKYMKFEFSYSPCLSGLFAGALYTR